MIGRFEFSLYLDGLLAEALLREAILDAEGRPISSLPSFEAPDESGQICLVGYQGYQQHNPVIQAFAQQSPENFAQVLMFAPLTANTGFDRFSEWFQVLMKWLRGHDRVTQEEVGNFVSGVGAERTGVDKGKMLASVIDRGDGNKSALIAYVWSHRDELYREAMKLASEGAFVALMEKFAALPGVQPVKAGFIVQMLFGQLGCLDVHNQRLYSAVARLMAADPRVPRESKRVWAELEKMIGAGKGWRVEGKNEPGGQEKLQQAVRGYAKVLDFMKQEMGINPRVLWDVWVNYVAQRYSDEGMYSPHQGLAYDPRDPEMRKVFGKDRVWTYKGLQANVIKPHKQSGAVSRVHLMAAITPDELLSQMDTQLGNKYHLANSVLRSDPSARPALQALSSRIMDQEQMAALMQSGQNVNIARAAAKQNKLALFGQLVDRAKQALEWVLTHPPYSMSSKDAERMIDIYVTVLKKNYRRHMAEIVATLRAQATRQQQQLGTYVGDDEKVGHGLDTYSPADAFTGPEDRRGVGDKTDRLTHMMEPYVPGMKGHLDALKRQEDLKGRLPDQIADATTRWREARRTRTAAKRRMASLKMQMVRHRAALEALPEDDPRRGAIQARLEPVEREYEQQSGAYRDAAGLVDQYARQLRRWRGQLGGAGDQVKATRQKLRGQGDAEIARNVAKHRRVLHGMEDDLGLGDEEGEE